MITAEVPPSGRIEARAQRLAEVIERKAGGQSVNIIAYVSSVGGVYGTLLTFSRHSMVCQPAFESTILS